MESYKGYDVGDKIYHMHYGYGVIVEFMYVMLDADPYVVLKYSMLGDTRCWMSVKHLDEMCFHADAVTVNGSVISIDKAYRKPQHIPLGVYRCGDGDIVRVSKTYVLSEDDVVIANTADILSVNQLENVYCAWKAKQEDAANRFTHLAVSGPRPVRRKRRCLKN